jgi:hypothetical protein
MDTTKTQSALTKTQLALIKIQTGSIKIRMCLTKIPTSHTRIGTDQIKVYFLLGQLATLIIPTILPVTAIRVKIKA